MPGFLRKGKSLEDLEAESEHADAELSLAEKRMLLQKVKDQYGDGGWKLFSKNGLKSGIAWDEMKFKVGDVSHLRGRY